MARPRVFISSTFYDLKHVRVDLELFVRELGFDPILNERGHIPYGSTEPLEENAYREVELADIVVSIIGGRFGAESSDEQQSISQRELEKAIKTEKQVYIFIERAVQVEYSTYLLNKDNPDVRYQSVDDVRVFKFLEQIEQLPRNNAIASFETAPDISDYLKEQWAGLFQNLLRQERVKVEGQNLARIERTANTLERLLKVAAENASDTNQLVKDVVLTNHPAFAQIQNLLDLSYRVFFTTRDELNAWLLSAAGFGHEVRVDLWDDAEYAEWYRHQGAIDVEYDILWVCECLFDEGGSLKPVAPDAWDDKWIRYKEVRPVATSAVDEKG
ncbi:MAG TPA: DUF4062 domain-containing protein [Solirubrobacterales bacterium]|nr:DUF4062 domain-containing protein [Solirubrobacterales bacterium]